MSRPWLYPWLPAALLLGCAALGYQALRQRTEIVQVNLALNTEDQADQKRVADLRRQLAAAESGRSRAEKQAAQLAQAPALGGPPRTIHQSDIARDNPEYAAILAHQQRRNIVQQYGAALDGLNLRPEQLAKLKDLLVERNLSTQDARDAAKAAGLEQNSPDYWAAIKQATDAVDQEMTTVVGSDGAAFMQKLQTASYAQQQIRYNYAPDFDDAGASLTPDQNRGLAQILGNARSIEGVDPAARRTFFQADPATGLSPSDNRTLEAAAQILSPAQVQVLKADAIQSNRQSAILQPYFAGATGGIRIMP